MVNMSLRQMMIESVAEFEMLSGNAISPQQFLNLSDEELIQKYRNVVYDEGYTDGHVEGYMNGMNERTEENRKIDAKVRLN